MLRRWLILSIIILFISSGDSPAESNARLVSRGQLQVAGMGVELAVSGQMAFAAAGAEGLYAVDVSTPEQPVVAAVQSGIGTVVDVETRGREEIYALVRDYPAEGEASLLVFRLTPDNHFVQRSFLFLSGNLRAESLYLLYPSLDIALANPEGTTGKMLPVDITNPDSPAPTYGQGHNLRYSPRQAVRHPLDGFYDTHEEYLVYYAAGTAGFSVERLSLIWWPDYLNPDPRVDTPGYSSRLVYSPPFCYAADGQGGLRIFRPDKEYPTEEGVYVPEEGIVLDLDVEPPLAALSLASAGVEIVDVSQPGAIQPIARLPLEDNNDLVQAISFSSRDNLVIYLTGGGTLGVAEYQPPIPDVDLSNDGLVDYKDAFLIYQSWGKTYPTSSPTSSPETTVEKAPATTKD
jgi:hypothetical protein